MATLSPTSQNKNKPDVNWTYFLQDNLTGSPLLLISVLIMLVFTGWLLINQFIEAPSSTLVVFLIGRVKGHRE